jgi:hypothetical protein
MDYRYIEVTEQSALRKFTTALDSNTSIHNEGTVYYFYRPTSACERSAYEALWHQYSSTAVSSSNSLQDEENRLVTFALNSGLSKDTLKTCMSISGHESKNSVSTISREEFYNYLRSLSFAQTFGIQNVILKANIISSKFMDFPLPHLSDVSLISGYPSVFYFPHSKLEINAYEDFWQKACTIMDINHGDADFCSDSNKLNATAAVKFVVASRLKRSM